MNKFKPLFRLWLCLAVICYVGAQAPRPAHAGLFSISPNKERQIGNDAAKQIEAQTRIVNGPVADWVNSVGQRLASVSNPEFKYSFKVIDSPEINAFTLPGGYIYVFTGLRRVVHTDDELAAVLGHEITHAEQHHFAHQYSKNSKRGMILNIGSLILGLPDLANQAIGIANYAVEQKYSRSQESEADYMGMLRMVRAGFNPQGMVSLLNNLAKESPKEHTLDKWFGDHPDAPERVTTAQTEIQEINHLQAQHSPLIQPAFAAWQTEQADTPETQAVPASNDPTHKPN